MGAPPSMTPPIGPVDGPLELGPGPERRGPETFSLEGDAPRTGAPITDTIAPLRPFSPHSHQTQPRAPLSQPALPTAHLGTAKGPGRPHRQPSPSLRSSRAQRHVTACAAS